MKFENAIWIVGFGKSEKKDVWKFGSGAVMRAESEEAKEREKIVFGPCVSDVRKELKKCIGSSDDLYVDFVGSSDDLCVDDLSKESVRRRYSGTSGCQPCGEVGHGSARVEPRPRVGSRARVGSRKVSELFVTWSGFKCVDACSKGLQHKYEREERSK